MTSTGAAGDLTEKRLVVLCAVGQQNTSLPPTSAE